MSGVITRALEFSSDIERVWKALTDPSEIAKWFSDRVEFDPRPGSPGWLEWDKHGRYPLRVEAVEPPHRISWSWSHDPDHDFDPENSTLVEWTLSEREEGGTLLELRESGFRTEADYQENQGGWTAELGELAELLEGQQAVSCSSYASRAFVRWRIIRKIRAGGPRNWGSWRSCWRVSKPFSHPTPRSRFTCPTSIGLRPSTSVCWAGA